MKVERIPVSMRQIVLLGLIVAGPILFGAGVVLLVAPNRVGTMTAHDWAVFNGLLVFSAVASAAVCISVARRRTVVLDTNTLTIKTSFYSLELQNDQIAAITLKEVNRGAELGISTKRNGVAAFGYLSGWFNASYGERIFCAVSTYPVYHVTFKGNEKCSGFAISATDAIKVLLKEWSNLPNQSVSSKQ